MRQGWIKYLYKKIQEVEEKEWQIAMNNKPKLKTYITFKKKFEFERYLLSDPKSQRDIFLPVFVQDQISLE